MLEDGRVISPLHKHTHYKIVERHLLHSLDFLFASTGQDL